MEEVRPEQRPATKWNGVFEADIYGLVQAATEVFGLRSSVCRYGKLEE